MYEQTIPPMTRALGAMSNILSKAETHCADHKIKSVAILNFRLFPDMFDFTKQVQLTCDFAARGAARLTGSELPSFADTETDFAQLTDRVARAQTYLATFDPAQFNDAAERVITLKLGGTDMDLTGAQFLSNYCLPQLYFHLTTTYNILRHNGITLGKRDYMGA